MAMQLKLKDRDAVVGKLVRVWCWADQNSIDGTSVTVSEAFLDDIARLRGFASAMRAVGWLAGVDGALSFPHFARHNGSSAKLRATETRRKQVQREGREEDSTVPKAPGQNPDKCPGEKRDKDGTDVPEKNGQQPGPDEDEDEDMPPTLARAGEGARKLPPVVADGWYGMESSHQLNWLERIAAAWGLKAAPQVVLPLIRRSIEVNGMEPHAIWLAVRECAALVRDKAPGGFSAAFVPSAQVFFAEEQWRSPEALQNRWDAAARGNGHFKIKAQREEALRKAASLGRRGVELPPIEAGA